MQLCFTCKYLLSFTGNVPLTLYFELIFCFEAMFRNFPNLTIKHIYIAPHVSRITDNFKQNQYDESSNLSF